MTGARVAIIPARGGSKRIPRKNIRSFCGRPMLAWPIAAARASGLFDQIVVSTEDLEVAAIARACGAQTPFVRPAALADDHATTLVVMQHAIKALGDACAYACCIYPTAPMLEAPFLEEGLRALEARDDKAYALGVTRFEFPVQRAITIDADGAVAALYPEFRDTRSQDLEEAYHDAGQFCWGRAQAWREGIPVFSSATLPVILPRRAVQDIDTPEDWALAEELFRLSLALKDKAP